MEYLLFVFWLVFFVWLATKTKFFKRSGLSNAQLSIIFLLKVMAGILYGWIGLYYGTFAHMSDTWYLHYGSVEQYHLLYNDPKTYFTNLFITPDYGSFSNFLGSGDTFWNDLKLNLLVKALSLFDVLSFGNYYINVIFYSFLLLFGSVALYKVMIDVFPQRKLPVIIAVFFIPSFLYWTSGIHKDGLTFAAISIIIFSIYFALKEKKWKWYRFFFILFGLAVILVLRNYILIIIIPAIITWLIAAKWNKHALPIFCGMYVLFAVLFFTAKYINPRLDFPKAVVTKQYEFMQLTGGSFIPVKKLEPTAGSFIRNFPQAFSLSVLRPYPTDVINLFSLVSAIETSLFLFLFLLFIFFRIKEPVTSKSFIYFCVFFSFSVLITIGYTVNFLGAIVRYRSIIIPFLMVPVIAQIDWKRLRLLFFKNIK